MRRALRFTFFLALVYSFVSLAVCQTPQPTPDLNNPDSLLAAAIASNGLGSDDLKPWHLKATYDIFDHKNKIVASGEFEEWWTAKDRWKRSYTGAHYTNSEYHLPNGYAHEGSGLAVPWPEMLIADSLLNPIEKPPVP